MSLGGAPTDGTDPLSRAVNDAVDQGLVVVVAAGNDNDYDYFTVSTPGAAEKAITVGASDKEDDLANFSSKGPTLDLRVKPDVVAPGVDIIVSRANGTSMGYPYNDYYTEASGTSMATPHVAGAAALILQMHPDWTPEEVKNVLISTAEDLGYNVYQQGGGRIYVPSAANPKILVEPATMSFKNLNTATNKVINFKNIDSVSHDLTLDVTVTDALSDIEVSCASLNRTTVNLAPGSSASVLLTINATSLPHSLYSGKISTTYSGGEVHSFGFSNGFSNLKVIYGVTTEVLCEESVHGGLLSNVNISVYNLTTDNFITSTISDNSGNYEVTVPEPGDYRLIANKTGFNDVIRDISVINKTSFNLNFRGNYGLLPEDPDMSYVLECINH